MFSYQRHYDTIDYSLMFPFQYIYIKSTVIITDERANYVVFI